MRGSMAGRQITARELVVVAAVLVVAAMVYAVGAWVRRFRRRPVPAEASGSAVERYLALAPRTAGGSEGGGDRRSEEGLVCNAVALVSDSR